MEKGWIWYYGGKIYKTYEQIRCAEWVRRFPGPLLWQLDGMILLVLGAETWEDDNVSPRQGTTQKIMISARFLKDIRAKNSNTHSYK